MQVDPPRVNRGQDQGRRTRGAVRSPHPSDARTRSRYGRHSKPIPNTRLRAVRELEFQISRSEFAKKVNETAAPHRLELTGPRTTFALRAISLVRLPEGHRKKDASAAQAADLLW
jgi:hypothetical protein